MFNFLPSKFTNTNKSEILQFLILLVLYLFYFKEILVCDCAHIIINIFFLFFLLSYFLKKECLSEEQELSILNAQLHPHFLYNSLNIVYNLSINESEKTPEVILKLSDLLDYVLYKVNEPKVLLFDEINHLNNFIIIQKLRFKDSLNIVFVKKNISYDFELAPLLLMPFLENAIKHGAQVNGIVTINLVLEVIDDRLYFCVSNNVKQEKGSNKKDGIGLFNIKKRLDILYKNQYHLKILKKNNQFKIFLKIKNFKLNE